jgi:hypothetical protein
MSAAPRRRTSRTARIGRGLAAAALGLGMLLVAPLGPAAAEVVCDPQNQDVCVVVPDEVQTPLGLVTVTATAANVVTVHLEPTSPNTLVVGIPVAFPPGPPVFPGYTRTSIATTGGLVVIDTFQLPPGPPTRPARPSLAVISIHPPSPCRVATTGTTVVFTPVVAPG